MAYNFVTNDNLDLVEEDDYEDDNVAFVDIEDIEVTDEEDEAFWDEIEGEEYKEGE
jgi:hypothetical protein